MGKYQKPSTESKKFPRRNYRRWGRRGDFILFFAFFLGTLLFGFVVTVKGQVADSPGARATLLRSVEKSPVRLYQVVSETVREVTAYNVGDRSQTDEHPCIGASGDNLCSRLERGEKICALNGVPLGTILVIQNYGECIVMDRMNSRYRNRVDIAMKVSELGKARKFGLQRLNVEILEEVRTTEN